MSVALTGGELAVRSLAAHGVELVFGIPGDSTSSGTESDCACPAAAATFSSAGPAVVITTPGRPDARA